MRDFLYFGGGDRAEEVPCGSRVGGKPTYAEGLPPLHGRANQKWHFMFFNNSTFANSIAVENFRNLCYNNKRARQVCQNA